MIAMPPGVACLPVPIWMYNMTMHNMRDITSRNRRSILSCVSCTFILAFVFMSCVSAIAVPTTGISRTNVSDAWAPVVWVYRTNFVDTWNSVSTWYVGDTSNNGEPCPLGNTILITLATDTQADVGFGDGRRTLGYKSYFLKSTPRYILALDDESLPAPFLIIDEEDRLEAWHAPTDKAPVCVYEREE